MHWLTAGIVVWLSVTDPVLADVYISIKADGGYVLSNVHRPGRKYERVVSEPEVGLASSGQAQLITGMPYAELVAAAAEANDLPPALLHAVIQAESRYNPNARSASGAVGLMQLMPDTARELGVKNALDPASNIKGEHATSSACSPCSTTTLPWPSRPITLGLTR